MQQYYLLVYLIFSGLLVTAQSTVVWDGGGDGTNWSDSNNWQGDVLPNPTDFAVFNGNDSITGVSEGITLIRIGTNANVVLDLDVSIGDGISASNGIVLNSGAQLRIDTNRVITINTPANRTAITNTLAAPGASMIISSGATVNILNTFRGVNWRGAGSSFLNEGNLNIALADTDGIFIDDDGVFTNRGAIAIGIVDGDGVDNEGVFINTGEGNSLRIGATTLKGIRNKTTGTFSNLQSALIQITDATQVISDGIFSEGEFNNGAANDFTPVIQIDSVRDDALEILRDTFSNYGTLNLVLRAQATNTNNGISVGSNTTTAAFINYSSNSIYGSVSTGIGGVINTVTRQIRVISGSSFVNEENGKISLTGGNPNSTILNQGGFTNNGALQFPDGGRLSNSSVFENNGLIESSDSDPGVFTNTGASTVNNLFYRNGVTTSNFSAGTTMATDNGFDLNSAAINSYDMGGSCSVATPFSGFVWSYNGVAFDSDLDGTITIPNGTFPDASPQIITITLAGVNIAFTVSNFCMDAVLPIELTYFQAEALETSVMLKWQTSSETNNDYMAIERIVNGRVTGEVGRISGQGDSQVLNSYSLEDKQPSNGLNYYRLRQVDFDGTTSFSEIISANFRGEAGSPYSLYPTSISKGSQPQLDLQQLPTDQEVQLAIVDAQGRTLQQYRLAGGTTHRLSLPSLSAGMYQLVFTNDAQAQPLRFIIVE